MAGWRDRLKPARWRGVAFHVDSSEMEAGRRVVLHEYPLCDLPSSEDLGRSKRGARLLCQPLARNVVRQSVAAQPG